MDCHTNDITNKKLLSDCHLPACFKSSRQSRDWKKTTRLSNRMSIAVSTLFDKQLEIYNDDYKLPAPDTMFTENAWNVNDLQNLKRDLNGVKSKLNDYNLMEWRNHTRKRNAAGDIKWRLQREVNPEFLTQAWCKFYELASSFALVPEEAIHMKKFKSIHLCEAPGAFVTSLNHWLKLNTPIIDWKWTATTLNPYYEGNSLSCMLNDDRFILHTMNHWYFGADNTGNLMNLKNLDRFVETEKKDREITRLITADGSIDCLNVPEEQEATVSHLHFCETIAALHLLNVNGSFLLKIFTMFEYQTVCLIFLLSCCFNKVFIKKPAASKEGNSEVYIVCLDFKGPEYISPYLSTFRQYYEKKTELAMFRKSDIPSSFVDQIVKAGAFFKTYQCKAISDNINAFNCVNVDVKIRKIKRAVADYFIKNYNLQRLPSQDMEIVGVSVLTQSYCQILDSKISYDSYNDRQKKDSMRPQERLLVLVEELDCVELPNDIYTIQFTHNPEELQISVGIPYKKIQSSKFCQPKILKIYNSALEISDTLGLDWQYPNSEDITNFVDQTDDDTKFLIFHYAIPINNYNLIKLIYETIMCLKSHRTLILIGYSLLSQFNVGVLYLLGHTFQYVKMQVLDDLGCIITLSNYSAVQKVITYLNELLEGVERARTNNEIVLSVVPVVKLCDGNLYHRILDMNHLIIKHFVRQMTITINKL